MRFVALAMALLGATPVAAIEDTARVGLREDGGKPLAALQLRWPQTIVIMQAPVTVLGGHSIEIRREIAPSVSLGGTYRYSLGERFVSERFGLKLTVTR
ncbi:hypothetical protein ASE66_09705 [Bosea sp. Root483D1]|uniref:hypothetical protein n=1 Tax=Bosea sp. Root483D1 TaxID=1736544 RepID=UPI00071091EF|nr:hypothetical protein [Bosea sp. Root483D1]KRE16038.1 hypothetical protein ASE66_09705 [Bosea sp. Root483D1]